ncbi:phospholipid transport system transporter-binding protein [Hydrogenophaga palleronii]|uniref:Phospholipid transport system transporter-binding protein n=1 Tax=Hydrogenophaga palleronii TaxID=65655 RepID=A0ABU1WPW4_9BURK|nr:STAS domain-containing protein [Hydrogenophaga palleronii]MDR7151057.1 phospholipid transport system transporter-binding protein [Hydrogenophaga palleronii]
MSNQSTVALPDLVTLHVASGVLQAMSKSLESQTETTATVDAQGLQIFDSSAVAVLLELKRGLAQKGRQLQVINQPPKLLELVALYGVSELLPA